MLRADRREAAHSVDELLEAARVLGSEDDPLRGVRDVRDDAFAAVAGDIVREALRRLEPGGPVDRAGPRPGHDEAPHPVRMGDGEVENEVPPGRETREVDTIEPEPVNQPEKVLDEAVGTVCARVLGNVGRRVSPVVPGDHAIAAGEKPDLGLPGLHVARELVAKDDRHALPGRLVIEADPVYGFERHRPPSMNRTRPPGRKRDAPLPPGRAKGSIPARP